MQLVNQKQLAKLPLSPVIHSKQVQAPLSLSNASIPQSICVFKVAVSLAIVAIPFVLGVMSVDLLSSVDPAIVFWMTGVSPIIGLSFSLATLVAIWTCRKSLRPTAVFSLAPTLSAMIGFLCGLAALP